MSKTIATELEKDLEVNVEEIVAEAKEEAAKTETAQGEIKIDFKPEEFGNNLHYMGKGMLGIFIVIGIIIVSVYALSKIGKKKN